MCGMCTVQAVYRVPGLRRLHELRRVCGVLQLLGLALCRRAPRRARLIPELLASAQNSTARARGIVCRGCGGEPPGGASELSTSSIRPT